MSIKPSDLDYTYIEQIAGSDVVLVTDVRDVYKYENNKRTDVLEGYRYTVVAPDRKFAEFTIKTVKSFISPEQLTAAKGGIIKVRVKGFYGRFYYNREIKDYIFTSTAEILEVIPN